MAKEVNIEGMDKNDAITALINAGHDFKSANAYWIENRPERGTGFKARFYAQLETGPMSDEVFDKLIAGESQNIQKHKSAHNAVRLMANKIWEG